MSEPHFYRLRKETVRKVGDRGSATEICGRDFFSLVPGVSNSKRPIIQKRAHVHGSDDYRESALVAHEF